MAYIPSTGGNTSGVSLPDVEVLSLNNGASNTIQCDVGDFIIIDLWSEQATKVTITSGGVLVDRTTYFSLIKCTSNTLVLQLTGASYNYAWGTLIKKSKIDYTRINVVSGNTQYSNIPEDSIVYGRGDNNPLGVQELHNVVMFVSGTIVGSGMTPVVGFAIDSTNSFRFKQSQSSLNSCYLT